MTDLEKLIEAVEGGKIAGFNAFAYIWEKVFKPHETSYNVGWSAYQIGSLDAAKALHEALLPGYGSKIEMHGAVSFAWVGREDEMLFPQHSTSYHTPARAWLIAMLKAYRSLQ